MSGRRLGPASEPQAGAGAAHRRHHGAPGRVSVFTKNAPTGPDHAPAADHFSGGGYGGCRATSVRAGGPQREDARPRLDSAIPRIGDRLPDRHSRARQDPLPRVRDRALLRGRHALHPRRREGSRLPGELRDGGVHELDGQPGLHTGPHPEDSRRAGREMLRWSPQPGQEPPTHAASAMEPRGPRRLQAGNPLPNPSVCEPVRSSPPATGPQLSCSEPHP